jgi:hypothetical protein
MFEIYLISTPDIGCAHLRTMDADAPWANDTEVPDDKDDRHKDELVDQDDAPKVDVTSDKRHPVGRP